MSRGIQVYDGDGVVTPEQLRMNAIDRLGEIVADLRRWAECRIQYDMISVEDRKLFWRFEDMLKLIQEHVINEQLNSNDTVSKIAYQFGGVLGCITKNYTILGLGNEAVSCMSIITDHVVLPCGNAGSAAWLLRQAMIQP